MPRGAPRKKKAIAKHLLLSLRYTLMFNHFTLIDLYNEEVFHPVSKHGEVSRKNEARPSFCLSNFEVFGSLMKHSLKCLTHCIYMQLLKPLVILGEIQSKTSPNFIIVERFNIAFTANGKRQAEIFSLMKNNEAFLV